MKNFIFLALFSVALPFFFSCRNNVSKKDSYDMAYEVFSQEGHSFNGTALSLNIRLTMRDTSYASEFASQLVSKMNIFPSLADSVYLGSKKNPAFFKIFDQEVQRSLREGGRASELVWFGLRQGLVGDSIFKLPLWKYDSLDFYVQAVIDSVSAKKYINTFSSQDLANQYRSLGKYYSKSQKRKVLQDYSMDLWDYLNAFENKLILKTEFFEWCQSGTTARERIVSFESNKEEIVLLRVFKDNADVRRFLLE